MVTNSATPSRLVTCVPRRKRSPSPSPKPEETPPAPPCPTAGPAPRRALPVGDLRAAQEALALAVLEARVDAAGVAVPDVDHRVGDRLARAGVAHAERQSQGDPLAVLADVAADRVHVE